MFNSNRVYIIFMYDNLQNAFRMLYHWNCHKTMSIMIIKFSGFFFFCFPLLMALPVGPYSHTYVRVCHC